MNPIRLVRSLPQPLKTVYVLFLLTFAAAFVSVPLLREDAFRVFGVLGVAGGLMGLCLVTDLRGSAQAWARATSEQEPWGIDFSRSVVAQPRFARLMGAGLLLVGAWFVVLGTGVVA